MSKLPKDLESAWREFERKGVISDHAEVRIKPKKVKRWVAFKWDNFYVLPRHYETKEGAERSAASSMMGEFQYKEIEVEV